MEHLPRIHHIAALPQSPRVTVKIEHNTIEIYWTDHLQIRIESMNKDNSHSWVRISHGLNKLVTNLNNKDQDDNEQETSEMQFEEHALKLNASDFASRSKAKAKPQGRNSASSSTRTIPIGKEPGPILNHNSIRSPFIQCRRN